VRIRDDGKGSTQRFLRAADDPDKLGHIGHARAGSANWAQLAFWSKEGAGTEVQLTVPGAIGYEKHRDGHRFRLFHREGGDERRS
jgi:hypothetical protein